MLFVMQLTGNAVVGACKNGLGASAKQNSFCAAMRAETLILLIFGEELREINCLSTSISLNPFLGLMEEDLDESTTAIKKKVLNYPCNSTMLLDPGCVVLY